MADLNLKDSRFQILQNMGRKYLTQDTFKLLVSNYEMCAKNDGYIFPVFFTDTGNPYWLFYYPLQVPQLSNLQADCNFCLLVLWN